ncbi:MAG: DUF2924 domain-containing protein [Alphaproteobacteria bacterium]
MSRNGFTDVPDTPARSELVAAWINAYGNPPPKRTSNRLLMLSYHYHRQTSLHGGLSKKSIRKLDAWARGANAHDPGQGGKPDATPVTTGTRLVREWNGRIHVVDVEGDTMRYNGHTFSSLSAVARAITGARWSGPRFFGVGSS